MNKPPTVKPQSDNRLLARLFLLDRVVWIVVAACFILGLFVALNRIPIGEAVVAAGVLLALAAFLPRSRSRLERATTARAEPADTFDSVVAAVANAMSSPTLVLDERAMVTHCNAAAAEQFPHAGVGAPISHAFRQPALLEAFDGVRASGLPQAVELQQVGPNTIWYAVSIAPFSMPGRPDAEKDRFLVTFTNLTEQRRTETMRVDFVANASHELRTPLASIVGFIDTLLGPAAEDAEARMRFLGIMRTQAERMSNLIEDLLSLSRIEMRQHIRPSGSTDLSKLLREVAEGLQNQIDAAGLVLDLQVEACNSAVTGNHAELYQVFENLVDNAIKYGAGGGRVLLQLRTVSNMPEFALVVTVQDFGAGIEPEHVPRLTERFYRIDADSSRRKNGTGLGLAIAKHIVNRHRGQMTIRSAPGQGLGVDVFLPR